MVLLLQMILKMNESSINSISHLNTKNNFTVLKRVLAFSLKICIFSEFGKVLKNVKLSSGTRQSEVHLNCTETFSEQLMEKIKIINNKLIRVFVIEEEPLEVLVVDEVVIKNLKEVLLSLVQTCK